MYSLYWRYSISNAYETNIDEADWFEDSSIRHAALRKQLNWLELEINFKDRKIGCVEAFMNDRIVINYFASIKVYFITKQ